MVVQCVDCYQRSWWWGCGCISLHPEYSIIQAEAWDIREAVKAALSFDLKSVCIEGDNINVIDQFDSKDL